VVRELRLPLEVAPFTLTPSAAAAAQLKPEHTPSGPALRALIPASLPAGAVVLPSVVAEARILQRRLIVGGAVTLAGRGFSHITPIGDP